MSNLLDDNIKSQVKEFFNDLKEPVSLLFFGSETENCQFCEDTKQLLDEISKLSDLIEVKTYDIEKDASVAQKYRIDKVPATVIAAKDEGVIQDSGIKYFGIPSGHEFSSLVNSIRIVSMRDSGLSPKTRETLKNIKEPVQLQVFVTPTCPYCPRAVVVAHQMAFENPFIEANMIEAMEFPTLSDQFGVSGVPHTTINATAGEVIGAVGEDQLLAEILQVLG